MSSNHDLDLTNYSLTEILGLFRLPEEKLHDLDVSDMKSAKHIAAMTHPDKSGLSDAYFLFYRAAFEKLSAFYRSHSRHRVSREERLAHKRYDAALPEAAEVAEAVAEAAELLRSAHEFNGKFQELFETHVGAAQSERRRKKSERDCWMSDAGAGAAREVKVEEVKSLAALHSAFRDLRDPSSSARSVTTTSGDFRDCLFRGGAHDLYEDEDEEEEAEADEEGGVRKKKEYVSSDIFNSKLRFDDLRRVHRDQTIFDVSDASSPSLLLATTATLDGTRRSRETDDAAAVRSAQMDRDVAEDILRQREIAFQRKMMQRGYNDSLKTARYEETNKQVLAAFLQISN